MARAMAFHQRSCNSARSHDKLPPAVLICNADPPATPSGSAGTPRIFACASTLAACTAATEITTRPWVSPKSSASRRISASADKSISAPMQARGFARDLLRDAAFRERHGQAAFAAIVRAFDHAGMNQRAQGEVQFFFLFQIATRRRAGFQAVNALQIGRTAEAEQRIAVCPPVRPAE